MGVYKPLRLLQCPDVKNLGLLSLNIARSKGSGKRRSATPRPLGSIGNFKEWYGNSRVA